MKRAGHLPLSQYTEIWRTLLLMATVSSVISTFGGLDFFRQYKRITALKDAIDEFYSNAFSPEIVTMLTFIEFGEVAASLLAKYSELEAGLSGKAKSETTDLLSRFRTELLRIRRSFEAGLRSIKLDRDLTVFIDGVDVRPTDIWYSDYFECVRGLMEAVWAVNADFLSNIKDLKGRLRVVLLVRPDTFLRAGYIILTQKFATIPSF